jgi:ABC-type uncharacterized transport system substrate-binding protein
MKRFAVACANSVTSRAGPPRSSSGARKATSIFIDQARRTADYVDKILRGARSGDLPIEQATKLYFAVNLKTARALDLDIPPEVLARADEVIE